MLTYSPYRALTQSSSHAEKASRGHGFREALYVLLFVPPVYYLLLYLLTIYYYIYYMFTLQRQVEDAIFAKLVCPQCGFTYADVCWRMLTYAEACVPPMRSFSACLHADICWRMLTYADVCWLCWRMPTLRRQVEDAIFAKPVCPQCEELCKQWKQVRIRQHTSA